MTGVAAGAIPGVALRGTEIVPRLGLGTWRMGESRGVRKDEVRVLRHALDRGMRLIDTAEMYGDGGAEQVVGEALRDWGGGRESLFLVSKIYPWNASRRGTRKACEASLRRLGVDCIDLYLLHWRGEHPLADTVAALEQLCEEGKIRYWGVSNFDTADMRELAAIDTGGRCQVNQVYYNLAKRWPEATLLPWQRRRGVATMAYSPLDQGRLLKHPIVREIAENYGVKPVQIALAWLLAFDDVITIPKSSRSEGVDAIFASAGVQLSEAELVRLNQAFPTANADARMETT